MAPPGITPASRPASISSQPTPRFQACCDLWPDCLHHFALMRVESSQERCWKVTQMLQVCVGVSSRNQDEVGDRKSMMLLVPSSRSSHYMPLQGWIQLHWCTPPQRYRMRQTGHCRGFQIWKSDQSSDLRKRSTEQWTGRVKNPQRSVAACLRSYYIISFHHKYN